MSLLETMLAMWHFTNYREVSLVLSVTGLPPSTSTTPQIQRTGQELFSPPLPASPPLPTVSTVVPTGDSIELLASLRQHSHTVEQALYPQLATTPVGALNNVRRAFIIAAKGAGRPARVGGELAGLAAAGVDAHGVERQEQLHVIIFLSEAAVYGVDAAGAA
ncbi:hypothetical protein DFH08DRAFT_957711 [Mycena albidolilacea]|uniref:Uncharacterized protein n=1 Tax=Mycena albidolilacea TaxID=1033008 RepID=A0AAD7EVH2_9AGAR|nr:hypothetical protein DFH08DRAFT_957711 [Mycena albidolilacea]